MYDLWLNFLYAIVESLKCVIILTVLKQVLVWDSKQKYLSDTYGEHITCREILRWEQVFIDPRADD